MKLRKNFIPRGYLADAPICTKQLGSHTPAPHPITGARYNSTAYIHSFLAPRGLPPGLLSSLNSANCLQVTSENDLATLHGVDPCIGTTELLCYFLFLQTLDTSYEQFNEIDCYIISGMVVCIAVPKLHMNQDAFLQT